ncbi:hypothetical protein SBOR_0038 [Sclerotinia borealis F-4128]|uniref:Uncharacterized protein n=1 Tax=Sclerotinia borealis (strain F-4128) TaxID=1432307 RepID=W9CY51_SCLBF|nr:hypothetical protein SBOR_0038 [Sclerotinia borealis F-4128]
MATMTTKPRMEKMTRMFRVDSWSKSRKEKKNKKKMSETNTQVANAGGGSGGIDTPPDYADHTWSDSTTVNIASLALSPPPSPPQRGDFSDEEEGGMMGEDGTLDGYFPPDPTMQFQEEPSQIFRRGVEKNIQQIVEGPEAPAPPQRSWSKEIHEVHETELNMNRIEHVESTMSEKSKRRAFWKGKGKDKGEVVSNTDESSPTESMEFGKGKRKDAQFPWGRWPMNGKERETGEEKGWKSFSDAKKTEEGENEEKDGKRRWTIDRMPPFKKAPVVETPPEEAAVHVMEAIEVESESERLEREHLEREQSKIERRAKYPDAVIEDFKEEFRVQGSDVSNMMNGFVAADRYAKARAARENAAWKARR